MITNWKQFYSFADMKNQPANIFWHVLNSSQKIGLFYNNFVKIDAELYAALNKSINCCMHGVGNSHTT